VPETARKFLIDPQVPDFRLTGEVKVIQEKATIGMRILEDLLL
jgi:NAD-dependent deacetylase